MANKIGLEKSYKGVLKKLACCVSAAGLACAFAPTAAFAAAGSTNEGGWFDLPTQSIDSFKHADTANGHEYTYSYLSSGIERVVGGFSQSMYYLMGINGVNFDRGLRNNSPWESVSNGRLTTNAVTAVDGIMGTSVNSQPDEFLWNSCYKLNQGGISAATDLWSQSSSNSVFINSGNVQTYDTVAVTVAGTEYAMPSVIFQEANFISDSDGEWTKEGGNNISQWVEIERARSGNADYNPYVATWTTASGGIHYGTELMYELAAAVDKATENSRDANGNATLMSRYVDANGTDTSGNKFASAEALAQSYEDFAKATQYYMIEQLDSGKISKKTVAVICGYQPAKDGGEASYAVRIFDNSGISDKGDTSAYGGRLANSLMNWTTDFNTLNIATSFDPADADAGIVKWYKASDIAKNADAIFVCDAPYGNNRNTYLATNQDGVQASTYSVDNISYDKTNENVLPLVDAVDAAKHAELYYKYPDHLFGVWYAQGFENCWMAPIAAAYLYPEAFTRVENVMAYAARNFWHINDSDVNGVLAATCYDISMPSGQSFGEPDANYQDALNGIMAAGNAYYLSSDEVTAKINAMNPISTEEGVGDLQTHDADALKARTSNGTAMYRLYNPNSGEHFYTSDVAEHDYLVSLGWHDEGTGWIAPGHSAIPVYRLYNSIGGEHHYTMKSDERDNLIAAGWSYEGIGWYSDSFESVTLYREYNPNAFANNHNYTTNKSEHDYLVSIGWNDEGTAWFGVN